MKVKIGSATVSIERGDITDWDVDAIVNAASPSLAMGAGVASAIKRKGGVLIEEEEDLFAAQNLLRRGAFLVGKKLPRAFQAFAK